MTDEAIPTIPQDAIEAAINALPPVPVKFIVTSKTYFNQDGLRIEHNTIVDGTEPPDFPHFVAHAELKVEIDKGNPSKGVPPRFHKQPLATPIAAKDIVEAYALAPALLDAECKRAQIEIQRQIDNARTDAAEAIAKKETTRKLTAGQIPDPRG
jgi:hypothetical protein